MIKRKLCTHDIIKTKIPTNGVVSPVVVTLTISLCHHSYNCVSAIGIVLQWHTTVVGTQVSCNYIPGQRIYDSLQLQKLEL